MIKSGFILLQAEETDWFLCSNKENDVSQPYLQDEVPANSGSNLSSTLMWYRTQKKASGPRQLQHKQTRTEGKSMDE